MNDSYDYLVKTLIQRGESDTYIRQRLLLAGLQDDLAYQLIQKTRKSTEIIHPHLEDENEALLIWFGLLALLILLAWLLLIQIG